jgi:hypothetical protein
VVLGGVFFFEFVGWFGIVSYCGGDFRGCFVYFTVGFSYWAGVLGRALKWLFENRKIYIV